MLLFVDMLLLFVGLFNFVNLFAVMRAHRRHELHVRRLFGASRWNIFCQLYAETFLIAVLNWRMDSGGADRAATRHLL